MNILLHQESLLEFRFFKFNSSLLLYYEYTVLHYQPHSESKLELNLKKVEL